MNNDRTINTDINSFQVDEKTLNGISKFINSLDTQDQKKFFVERLDRLTDFKYCNRKERAKKMYMIKWIIEGFE